MYMSNLRPPTYILPFPPMYGFRAGQRHSAVACMEQYTVYWICMPLVFRNDVTFPPVYSSLRSDRNTIGFCPNLFPTMATYALILFQLQIFPLKNTLRCSTTNRQLMSVCISCRSSMLSAWARTRPCAHVRVTCVDQFLDRKQINVQLRRTQYILRRYCLQR